MGARADAYAACRERIAALVIDLDDQRAHTTVPTCPDWSVHDVVAHLAGVVDDVLAGRLKGAGTDAWTAAQVEARHRTSVAEIVDEWRAKAAAFERMLDVVGTVGAQPVADVVSHEHDIRTALGAPGARDSDGVGIALGWVSQQVIDSAARLGISLRVRSADGFDLGPEDADVVLSAGPFELLRAMTGRRSVEQLAEMHWQGDYESAIPAFWWLSLHPAAFRIDEG
jgi:uncharacterized protein (TIGR03083 family)